MINKIKRHIETRKRKKLIRNFRGQLAFLGHDVSNMTDEEIEEHVARAGEFMSSAAQKAGLSAQEMGDSLVKLGSLEQSRSAHHENT